MDKKIKHFPNTKETIKYLIDMLNLQGQQIRYLYTHNEVIVTHSYTNTTSRRKFTNNELLARENAIYYLIGMLSNYNKKLSIDIQDNNIMLVEVY